MGRMDVDRNERLRAAMVLAGLDGCALRRDQHYHRDHATSVQALRVWSRGYSARPPSTPADVLVRRAPVKIVSMVRLRSALRRDRHDCALRHRLQPHRSHETPLVPTHICCLLRAAQSVIGGGRSVFRPPRVQCALH